VDTREFGGKASAKGVQVPGNRRARYTEEFKAEAVQLARSSSEKSMRQLAYEIGVADQTLRNWVKQAQIDRGERGGLTTEEREELRRLRKENKILREEREILKKPRPSPSRRKTGPGERIPAYRVGEGYSLYPYAVQACWSLSLQLLRLEEAPSFRA
jgi:transposase